MFNKKRIVIFVTFLCCLFLMTTFAGAPEQNTIIATRTVEFIDGYNNRTISKQNIEVGTDAEIPNDPVHDGYIFAGWYLFENQDEKVEDFTNILYDLKIIAKYQNDANRNGIRDEDESHYTVTFIDSIDGSVIKTEEVLTGMSATAPIIPTHAGYTFTGWSASYTNVTRNITVRTIYTNNTVSVIRPEEETINYYNIVFIDTLTNQVIASERIREGLTATTPSEPEHEGYIFIRWIGDFSNVTSNREIYTLYAKDENNNGIDDKLETKYTITFDAGENGILILPEGNEKTYTISNILSGTKFSEIVETLPIIKANENYIANGWNENIPDSEFKITENLTFTASYKEDKNNDGIIDEEQNLNTLTIQYVSYNKQTNEETLLDIEIIKYVLENTTYNVTVKDFEGYKFNETETKDLNITMPKEDYTFKVYYEKDETSTEPEIIEKEAKFNYNIVENGQIVNKTETKTVIVGWTLENKLDLTNITKSYELDGYKYTFVSWKTTDGTVLTEEEFNKIIVNDNLEFFATYDKTAIEYQLTINYNYPTEIKTELNPQYNEFIAYGSTYKVESPIIEYYVAVPRIVEGTMDIIGGKIINVDYKNIIPTLNIVKENGYKETIKLEINASAYTDEDLYQNNKIEKYYVNDIETTNEYEVTENGTYIVKVVDKYGNTNETTIIVNTIDKTKPVINVTGDNDTKYKPAIHLDGKDEHNYIEIPYDIDEENIEKIEYAKGNYTTVEEYKNNAENKTTILDKKGNIKVTVDGYYTIYVIDKAGHETVKTIHISGIKENKWYSFAHKNLTTEDEEVNIYLSITSDLNPRNRTIELSTKENVNILNVKYAKDIDKLDISYFKNKGIDTTTNFEIEGNKNDVFSIYFKYEVNGRIKEDIIYTKLWVD